MSRLLIIVLYLCFCVFNIALSQSLLWTWVSGDDAIGQPGVYFGESARPGARYAAGYWYESSTKELWMFGGQGFATQQSQTLRAYWSLSCFIERLVININFKQSVPKRFVEISS